MPNGLLDPRGEMRATPRNKLMGLLADALSAANDYAQAPDPRMPGGKANPVLGLLADAASLNSLATTAQRASYGEPLTNRGKANVPFLKTETADALMMAPISPRNALAALGLGMADTGAAKAIFAGIGAKTADKAALAQAEKMTAAGVDPKAIWRDTGWFKGGDGKWRFEIDDAGFKVNDWRATGGAISPEHPGLSEAYSGVDRIKVRSDDRLGGGTMGYVPWKDNLDFLMGDHGTIVYKPGETAPADAWLHELQHYVQTREGFSGGGSSSDKTLPSFGELGQQINRGFEAQREAARQTPEYKKAVAEILAQMPDSQRYVKSRLDGSMMDRGAEKAGYLADERLLGNIEAQRMSALEALFKDGPNTMAGIDDRYAAYKRLAGEAEARAVQSRMNMTPQQRREVFPLDSYDVPINSLIYR